MTVVVVIIIIIADRAQFLFFEYEAHLTSDEEVLYSAVFIASFIEIVF